MNIRLENIVEVSGSSFFGGHSVLSFEPLRWRSTPDWYWDTGEGLVPISPAVLTVKNRRLALQSGSHSLDIVEHILPMRFAGLSSICIKNRDAVSSGKKFSGATPYFGRVYELWQILRSKGVRSSIPAKWHTVKTSVFCSYAELGIRREGFTEIWPSNSTGLELLVDVDYPGIGKHQETFVFYGEKHLEIMEEIMRAKTQGWPPSLELLSRCAGFFGWPHHDRICWPNGRSSETIRSFALHRAQDILGALGSLCFGGRMFCGMVHSYRSGHLADFHAVKRAAENLRNLA